MRIVIKSLNPNTLDAMKKNLIAFTRMGVMSMWKDNELIITVNSNTRMGSLFNVVDKDTIEFKLIKDMDKLGFAHKIDYEINIQ